MPRKQPAKSAAAAASAAAAPAFTSFAAATAAALPAYAATAAPSLSSALEPSPWDNAALAHLKKLTKRDATTKLRALSDLVAHADALPSLAPASAHTSALGAAFVEAFPQSFVPLLLNDPSPAVRAAALDALPPIVAALRRAVAPALPTLIPAWVSALGDPALAVSAAAAASLSTALPPPDKARRAALKYAPCLRDHVSDILSRLRNPQQQQQQQQQQKNQTADAAASQQQTTFRVQALRAVAVLKWLLLTTGDPAEVVPLVDAHPDPLAFLAHPHKAARAEAPVDAVADLAALLATHCGGSRQSGTEPDAEPGRVEDTESRRRRAERLAELALLLAKHRHNAAWALALAVLRAAPDAFGPDFGRLPSLLATALGRPARGSSGGVPPAPAAFHAALPLLDALPQERHSAPFAHSLLNALRDGLGVVSTQPAASRNDPKDRAGETAKNTPPTHAPPAAYENVAFEAYVEALAFAVARGVDRWVVPEDRAALRAKLVTEHVMPTVRLFAGGLLPRLTVRSSASINSLTNSGAKAFGGEVEPPASTPRRRAESAGGSSALQERERVHVEGVARLLRQLDSDDARDETRTAATVIGDAVADGLAARRGADALRTRLIALLSGLVGNGDCDAITLAALLPRVCKPLSGSEPETATEPESETGMDVDTETEPNLSSLRAVATTVTELLRLPAAAVLPRGDGTGAGPERVVADFVVRVIGGLDKCGLDAVAETVKQIGSVCSWLVWATERNGMRPGSPWDDVIAALCGLGRPELKFIALADIMSKHARRRRNKCFAPCGPMKGPFVEENATLAASLLVEERDGENVLASAALRFLAAASEPDGGALLSPETFKVIADSTIKAVRRGHLGGDVDDLVIALLRSPVLHVVPEATVDELTSTSILRAARNDKVLDELVEGLTGLPLPAMKRSTTMMATVVKEHAASAEDALTGSSSLARIVAAFGERDVAGAVAVSGSVLSWASPRFTREYLGEIPLSAVFGDDDGVEVDAVRLLSALEDVSPFLTAALSDKFEAYIRSLQPRGTRRIAAKATSLALSGQHAELQDTLRPLLASWRVDDGLLKSACDEVGQRIGEVINDSSRQVTEQFSRVPQFVFLLAKLSSSACPQHMQTVVKDVTAIVRRDPSSIVAMVALDVLSALLTDLAESSSTTGRIAEKWMVEHVAQSLRAVRRTFEQPFGVKKARLNEMETYASRLAAVAIRTLDHAGALHDDERFWLLRCRDSLEKCVKEHCVGSSVPPSDEVQRLLNLCKLGAVLVDEAGTESGSQLAADTVEELCHWGAWGATVAIPHADTLFTSRSRAATGLWNTPEADSASKLVLQAATRGVVFRANGPVPVDRTRIYALLPHLCSSSATVRKAVIALVSFFAAVDLPKVVEAKFPEKGFSDESEEAAFAARVLPAELQRALTWHTSGPNPADEGAEATKEKDDEDEDEVDSTLRELGYFLAWRLFFDMIRLDEATGSDAERGEVSVRRVGVAFLRANDQLLAELLNRVTDVAVDGSTEERAAGARAASAAIRSEEGRARRGPQGIQLTRGDEAEEQTRKDEDGEKGEPSVGVEDERSLDKAVGQAAGVAFARALQRLPAMSRQHLRDLVDRGKTGRIEAFACRAVSPLLIEGAVRRAQEWGMFEEQEGSGTSSAVDDEETGSLAMRGSVGGREVRATYTFSDVTLELLLQLPETFPLRAVEVHAGARKGMSEARWRKTLLAMTTALRTRDGSLAEAVMLWRRNLDKTFQGAEECPICYSVLHLATGALPQMRCRTCRKLFHSGCLAKWFTKSNGSACPLCRGAFQSADR